LVLARTGVRVVGDALRACFCGHRSAILVVTMNTIYFHHVAKLDRNKELGLLPCQA
jgi:hypothetical protein